MTKALIIAILLFIFKVLIYQTLAHKFEFYSETYQRYHYFSKLKFFLANSNKKEPFVFKKSLKPYILWRNMTIKYQKNFLSFWAISFLKTLYFFITQKDIKSHNKLIPLPVSFKLHVRWQNYLKSLQQFFGFSSNWVDDDVNNSLPPEEQKFVFVTYGLKILLCILFSGKFNDGKSPSLNNFLKGLKKSIHVELKQ